MEWKVRALDDEGNPIEPKQKEEVAQEQEQVQDPKEVEVKEEQVKTEDNGVSKEEESNGQAEEQVIQQEEKVVEEKVVEEKPYELDDSSILTYLKDRHNKEYESIDVLLNNDNQEQSAPLPEDIQKFMDYKKETGRSFQDYANLQKDWSGVDDQSVMREYYSQTKPHLDSSEIDYLLSENYSYDTEVDDEKEVKAKQIAYKEELYKARQHFESLKEKYKAPLESREAEIPKDYKEALDFYNKYREDSKEGEKLQQERSRIFQEKTNQLFSDEFKGFEFNAGDKKRVFKPSDVSKVKESQSDINNFFSQHLDDNGVVKDIQQYHKALFAAQNADAIYKSAYEQGVADATEGIVKETKNIDMSVRNNIQTEKDGTKFRVIPSEDDFSFKIRKR